MKKYTGLLLLFLSTPLLVGAQGAFNDTYITTFINDAANVIRGAIPVLIAIAMLVFVWGAAVFILNSGDEQKMIAGRRKMVWGIVGLFVIVSVWGLVALIQQITGVGGGNVTPPQSNF